MILVFGDRSDGPTAAVLDACRARRAAHAFVDELRLGGTRVRLDLGGGAVSGRIDHDGWSVDLADVSGVYHRPTGKEGTGKERTGTIAEGNDARRAAERFRAWTELTDVPVANRVSAMASNGSKPYQSRLISPYFLIPRTIVTNEPDVVRTFVRAHGRVVYKSCSGLRSIVEEIDDEALARLDAIRWCPTQFQVRVEGTNVRVHVVGDRTIATVARSGATDYRYAAQQVGSAADLDPFDLPPDVAARCVALAHALGLTVAGIDLMQTGDGRWVCFEVNPSPGFTYFEDRTRQPIADAVVAHLSSFRAPRRAA
jgi:glutathione synthase/RimK-type ligase-like ATP-grasp enzyme